MRSGPGGRLYGSVTNAIVAAKLSELLETTIDRRIIAISDSIRNVGLFTAKIRLHQEVDVEVELLVHPTDTDPETFIQQLADQDSNPDEKNQRIMVGILRNQRKKIMTLISNFHVKGNFF